MLRTKIVQVPATPATEKVVADDPLCDVCKGVIDDEGGCFDRNEVTIQHQVGEHYPEGNYGTYTEFHVCGECFVERIVPLFAERFGTKPTVRQYD